ncbi:hypothetical protein V2J09_001835 [Rumex salicifolius]
MRRSFGGSSGMGMGRGGAGAGGGGGFGGTGGGGGMFRTLSKVGTASVSTSSPSSSSSSSSSSSTCSSKKASKLGLSIGSKSTSAYSSSVALSDSSFNLGFGTAWPLSSFCDESDWIYVDDESSFETEIDTFDHCVFGSAPSEIEAHAALHSIQQTLPTSCHSDSDWIEPSSFCEQSVSSGISRVYDAFHLLQTESSVQRMVISLSSDKAVWNAVLNNQVVKEVREAFCKDEANALGNSGSEPNPSKSPTNVLSWILNNMRAKFMDFLEGITTLMTNQFRPPSENHHESSESTDGFGELVKSAFMLTAIVLLIVVMTRASHA